jgi:predicted acylesterase/phospholipase RssA
VNGRPIPSPAPNLATAASGLRRLPPFADVSLRLLQDLIEFASLEGQETPDDDAVHSRVWLVHEGVLQVDRDAPEPPRRVLPGRYYVARPGDRRFRAAPGHEGRLRFRRFDGQWMADALEASFTLASTISRSALKAMLDLDVPWAARRAHRIFLTRDPDLDAPLEALAQLLAAGIAIQFHERVAAVVLHDAGPVVSVWRDGAFVTVPTPHELAVSTAATADVLEAVVAAAARGVGEPCGLHLVFVHPGDPPRLPGWWRDERFHRVVYLTPRWELHQAPPRALLELLHPDLWNPARPAEGPFFSSFIPTVVIPPAQSPHTGRRAPLPFRLGPGLDGLETVSITHDGDFTRQAEPFEPWRRCYRDLCRVRLDLGALRRQWAAHTDHGPFAAAALRAAAAAIERWARAVTNRQVGVALSGGGALNALLVPVLERLAEHAPIDVVSGVSGGALLGAYLCHDNPAGLGRYCDDGFWFQVGLLGATLSSQIIERVLDMRLGAVRVEELETRLVALTTEVPDDAAPSARAVTKGTVGAAARLSGAAPGLFGPAAHGAARYLDGATALAVPGRILADFGADVTFAFNAVGAVREGNVLRAVLPSPLGKAIADVIHQLPLIGRVVDGLVAQMSLLQQASRAAAEDVDVYYEVPPEAIPLLRGFAWLSVRDIAAAAWGQEDAWQPAYERCVARWGEFASAPRRGRAGT